MINEFFITGVFLHLFIFTDWVPDLDTQYLLGWTMNLFVALIIVYNLYFVLTNGARSIFLLGVKIKNRVFGQRREPAMSFKQKMALRQA